MSDEHVVIGIDADSDLTSDEEAMISDVIEIISDYNANADTDTEHSDGNS